MTAFDFDVCHTIPCDCYEVKYIYFFKEVFKACACSKTPHALRWPGTHAQKKKKKKRKKKEKKREKTKHAQTSQPTLDSCGMRQTLLPPWQWKLATG